MQRCALCVRVLGCCLQWCALCVGVTAVACSGTHLVSACTAVACIGAHSVCACTAVACSGAHSAYVWRQLRAAVRTLWIALCCLTNSIISWNLKSFIKAHLIFLFATEYLAINYIVYCRNYLLIVLMRAAHLTSSQVGPSIFPRLSKI